MSSIPDPTKLTVTFRAFGRFCLIPEGRIGAANSLIHERVHLVGVRVNKNAALDFDPHFMTLAVPLTCVRFFTKRPDFTTATNHPDPRQVDELYLWNLSDCDVTLSGATDAKVTLPAANDKEDVPNLIELVPAGVAVLAPEFHTDRQRSAADCVMTIEAGTVTPLSPVGARQIEYQPLDESLAPTGIKRDIAEGLEVSVPAVGTEMTLNVHRRTDNVRWSITIEKDVVTKKDPVVTLGNSCGCVVNSDIVRRDEEFAAYYELLKDPGQSRQRLIPVLRPGFISIGSCDVPAILRI
jgi:hypothetical protein